MVRITTTVGKKSGFAAEFNKVSKSRRGVKSVLGEHPYSRTRRIALALFFGPRKEDHSPQQKCCLQQTLTAIFGWEYRKKTGFIIYGPNTKMV